MDVCMYIYIYTCKYVSIEKFQQEQADRTSYSAVARRYRLHNTLSLNELGKGCPQYLPIYLNMRIYIALSV